jgi:hypothetical protein
LDVFCKPFCPVYVVAVDGVFKFKNNTMILLLSIAYDPLKQQSAAIVALSILVLDENEHTLQDDW